MTRPLDREENSFEIAWHVPLDSQKNAYSNIEDIFKATTSFNILHTYKKEYLFGVVPETYRYSKIGYILEKLDSADSKQLVLRIMYPSYFAEKQRSLISVTLKFPGNIVLPKYNSQFHLIGFYGKYNEQEKRFTSTTVILWFDSNKQKLYTIQLEDLHLLQQDVAYENDQLVLQEYNVKFAHKINIDLTKIDFSVMKFDDKKFYFGESPNRVSFSKFSLNFDAKAKENNTIKLAFPLLNENKK
ncbi:hypothetical protein IPH25_03110 [bacterium]|nr:MAG: hypothetical protein IPG37_00100 [bacterium]QQR61456.1 MAG: hypothetical protein IPH25_03110 [bacterium]QQR63018.1 MAG: hypothetical protein IPH67_00900 [bacterium]